MCKNFSSKSQGSNSHLGLQVKLIDLSLSMLQEFLTTTSVAAVAKTSFNATRPTKVIIHGFIDSGFVPWVKVKSSPGVFESFTSEVSEMVEMLNELKFTNPPPHAKKLRKISLVGKENSNCESVCPSVRSREEVK